MEWLDANTAKIDEGKYGCGQPNCTKRFWGPEFVHKHLKTKHLDTLAEARKQCAPPAPSFEF